jgi:hypothetical protein
MLKKSGPTIPHRRDSNVKVKQLFAQRVHGSRKFCLFVLRRKFWNGGFLLEGGVRQVPAHQLAIELEAERVDLDVLKEGGGETTWPVGAVVTAADAARLGG